MFKELYRDRFTPDRWPHALIAWNSPTLDTDPAMTWPERTGHAVHFLPSPGDGHPARSEPERVTDSDKDRQARVLVVEDDWFIATETETILTQAGFEVTGMASDERGAMVLAEQTRPDLVLMDIKLARGSDGVDIARKLLDAYAIRCIFVTAHSDPATRQRGEAARPLGWLIKPFNNGQLLSAVRKALDERS